MSFRVYNGLHLSGKPWRAPTPRVADLSYESLEFEPGMAKETGTTDCHGIQLLAVQTAEEINHLLNLLARL